MLKFIFGLSLLLYSVISLSAPMMIAVVFKESKLMAAPKYDSELVTTFKANQKVAVKKRKGAWTQVATAKSSGWIPTLTLRSMEIKRSGDSANGSSLNKKFSGKKEVVATMGIRGLEEEEMKQAKFNEQQLNKLLSYKVEPKKLAGFSKSAGLVSKDIAYIDANGKALPKENE